MKKAVLKSVYDKSTAIFIEAVIRYSWEGYGNANEDKKNFERFRSLLACSSVHFLIGFQQRLDGAC